MDFLTYGLIACGYLLALGMGVGWGYLSCLRNHKLIKGEENMWDKHELNSKSPIKTKQNIKEKV